MVNHIIFIPLNNIIVSTYQKKKHNCEQLPTQIKFKPDTYTFDYVNFYKSQTQEYQCEGFPTHFDNHVQKIEKLKQIKMRLLTPGVA